MASTKDANILSGIKPHFKKTNGVFCIKHVAFIVIGIFCKKLYSLWLMIDINGIRAYINIHLTFVEGDEYNDK